jgi:ubiquinone/menaquinone biosynthesis C-methylase UbiE
MISVEELYNVWGTADYQRLDGDLERSLNPRGLASLYDIFAALGVGPEHVVLDAGARDAVHAIEIVHRIGCRAVAVDPLPLHIEKALRRVREAGLEDRIDVVEAALESLPFADGSCDYIWCRDVLNHVELDRALEECHRVLRRDGSMLAYQTFATDALEPNEAQQLFAASASRPENMSPEFFERTASDAGFQIISRDDLRGEWRESMLEEETWDAVADLLSLSRLNRLEPALIERFGRAAVEAKRGGLLWGVYQILGKTCSSIYVLERSA